MTSRKDHLYLELLAWCRVPWRAKQGGTDRERVSLFPPGADRPEASRWACANLCWGAEGSPWDGAGSVRSPRGLGRTGQGSETQSAAQERVFLSLGIRKQGSLVPPFYVSTPVKQFALKASPGHTYSWPQVLSFMGSSSLYSPNRRVCDFIPRQWDPGTPHHSSRSLRGNCMILHLSPGPTSLWV